MITFENEDKEYLRWLTNHEHGFVLNRRNKPKDTYMVHNSRCKHIYYKNDGSTRTIDKSKMCSDRLEELHAWADARSLAVVECPDCKPYGRV